MIVENMKSAVSEGNISRVRAIVLGQINSDRKQANFDLEDSCSYAEKNLAPKMGTLFDDDDGKSEFTESSSTWNKELWQSLRVEFEYNFSKKKLDNIIKLMQHLRKSGHPDFQILKNTASHSKAGGRQEAPSKKFSPPHDSRSTPNRVNPQMASEKKSPQKGEFEKYMTNGVLGAIAGGVAGSLLKMAIPGMIAGTLIGAAITYVIKKSKD